MRQPSGGAGSARSRQRGSAVEQQQVVRAVTHPSGRVTVVTASCSSGYPDLDRMALLAVPQRFPRFAGSSNGSAPAPRASGFGAMDGDGNEGVASGGCNERAGSLT